MSTGSLFMVVEGVDGAGKTTYIQRLKEQLELLGRRVVVVNQFGHPDTKGLRQHLVGSSCLTHQERSYFTTIDRFVQMREVIEPALEQDNTVVIADRWTPSTVIYGGVDIQWIHAHVPDRAPDLLAVLTLPTNVVKPTPTEGITNDIYDQEALEIRMARNKRYNDAGLMIDCINTERDKVADMWFFNAFTLTDEELREQAENICNTDW